VVKLYKPSPNPCLYMATAENMVGRVPLMPLFLARNATPTMYVFNHFMPDDLLRELVFFNTFEELNLPIKGPMEDSVVVKLYKPSPNPCLYVATAENMVGRVPLMPLFLAGNATPTISHLYSKGKDSCFLMGCADAGGDAMSETLGRCKVD
jgi:hypothetical protein